MKQLCGILKSGVQVKSCDVEVDVYENRFSITMDGQRLELDLIQIQKVIANAMDEYLHRVNDERIRRMIEK